MLEYGQTVNFEVKALQDTGTFEGYASTYGNTDHGGDIVAPGAFDGSISARPPGKVKMLFNHDLNEVIGVWQQFQSDNIGLKGTGRLLLETTSGKNVYEQIKAGALDSLSIGYRVLDAAYDRTTETRTIIKAVLMEVSVVTFPMNEMAGITGIKSEDIDGLNTLSDMERFLRDAGAGFSRKDATGFVSRMKSIIQREAERDHEQYLLKQLVAKMRPGNRNGDTQ